MATTGIFRYISHHSSLSGLSITFCIKENTKSHTQTSLPKLKFVHDRRGSYSPLAID